MALTTIDLAILKRLMAQGRASWADLGKALRLSAPAVAERVRKLESKGIIRGYTALVDPTLTGYGLTAFVSVTMARPHNLRKFSLAVERMPEIVECHHIAGDFDYVLKVLCKSTQDLDDFLCNRLKTLPRVQHTRTTIVLSTLKDSPSQPVDETPNTDPATI